MLLYFVGLALLFAVVVVTLIPAMFGYTREPTLLWLTIVWLALLVAHSLLAFVLGPTIAFSENDLAWLAAPPAGGLGAFAWALTARTIASPVPGEDARLKDVLRAAADAPRWLLVSLLLFTGLATIGMAADSISDSLSTLSSNAGVLWLVAGFCWAIFWIIVGVKHRGEHLDGLEEQANAYAAFAGILGASEADLQNAGTRFERVPYGDNDSATLISAPPAKALHAAADNPGLWIDKRVCEVLGGAYAGDATSDHLGRPAFLVRPASGSDHQRRTVYTETGGAVVGVTPSEGGLNLQLAPGTSPARAELVEGWASKQNLSLLTWRPHEGYARVVSLPDADRSARRRLAEVLGTRPWLLDVQITMEGDRLDRVTVRPETPVAKTLEAQREVWQEACLQLPDGSNGWKVDIDPATGAATLTYGEPRALPQRVDLESILPEPGSADWARIPLGRGEDGRVVAINLKSGPHSLYVGPTGSGKTICLLSDMTGRLLAGHDLVIIDPTKGGVDFSSIIPFTRGVARSMNEAVVAIQLAYAEGQRRKGLLLEHAEVKWNDLPAAVREAEGVRPLTIVIDELSSLLLEAPMPKGLDKDHPLMVEAQQLAAEKSEMKIMIGKVARELRFVGVHLALATQRPDASILSGEMRSNLTSVVQLIAPGKPPALETLKMAMPGDMAAAAFETAAALDDGSSLGLGMVAADGSGVSGMRVGFTPMKDIPELLAERGVSPIDAADQWNLQDSPADTSTPTSSPAYDELDDLEL